MHRILASFGVSILLGGALAGRASAHVHGITPLSCVGVADDGAFGIDGTVADDANDGPITGLIPRDGGKAPRTGGDGGRDTPACPDI